MCRYIKIISINRYNKIKAAKNENHKRNAHKSQQRVERISDESSILENTIAYTLDILFAKPTITFGWFPISDLSFEFD